MPRALADGPFTGAPTWFIALFISCGIAALLGVGFRALAAGRRWKVFQLSQSPGLHVRLLLVATAIGAGWAGDRPAARTTSSRPLDAINGLDHAPK